jgi:hypothetical protein
VRLCLAVVIAAAAGCAADEELGPPVQSTEQVNEWPLPPDRDLDILLVIDGGTALAAWRTPLDAMLRDLPELLEYSEGGLPDVHIGVVASDGGDGTLRRALRPGCVDPAPEPFVIDVEWDWRNGARHRNYSGALGDALICAARLDAGIGGPQPLEAAWRALEPDRNPWFRRERARLMVVIVSAQDDRSPDDVGRYVERMTELPSGPPVFFSVIAPPDAPRLDALLDAFPQRSKRVLLDDQDWLSGFEVLASSYRAIDGIACLEGAIADLDPFAPGVQPDCEVSRGSWDATQEVELEAEMCGDEPRGGVCYAWATDWCDTPSGLRLAIELRDERAAATYLRTRCLVE